MYITSFVVAKLSVLIKYPPQSSTVVKFIKRYKKFDNTQPVFDILYLDAHFTQLRFILGGSDDFEPDKSIDWVANIEERGEY